MACNFSHAIQKACEVLQELTAIIPGFSESVQVSKGWEGTRCEKGESEKQKRRKRIIKQKMYDLEIVPCIDCNIIKYYTLWRVNGNISKCICTFKSEDCALAG